VKVVVVVALVLLGSQAALAEQPAGTYTLDRGPPTIVYNGVGGPAYPRCGGRSPFRRRMTFVVEYTGRAGMIMVNGRWWRFDGYTLHGTAKTPTPDAEVTGIDPQSNDRIGIWFGTGGKGGAHGLVYVRGKRDGKVCVDAWLLTGRFTSPARAP
jgi:hypothetical protein